MLTTTGYPKEQLHNRQHVMARNSVGYGQIDIPPGSKVRSGILWHS